MLRVAPLLSLCCSIVSLALVAPGCGDSGSSDAGSGETSATETSGSGDGDGDPSTGDGDGDPATGDGDGDPMTGDGDGDPGGFSVGFDVTDVTPDEVELSMELYLGGYGLYTERGACEGVHDPVYVRSMAVGHGLEDGAVFGVVDTIGIGNLWTRHVRAEVAAATGLSEEQVVIGSTHTHAGPDLQGLWGNVPEVYRERLLGLVVDSMVAAWDQREPAALEVGATTADNRNRRGWDFTDEVLFALQARALDDDELLGTTVAFAAHPVVLGSDNLLVSRDWCGYAVDDLEQATGAPVVYFNGVQGDVSPKVPDGDYGDDFERAEAYGLHVSAQTQAAIATLEPVGDDFARGYQSFVLDVDNELFLLAAMSGLLDYDFDLVAETVTTQVAYFRLGTELQLVAFPGESLTRNGLPIREAMTAPYGAILGLSGDALGYFVPSDEWMTGLNDDYEESVSVGEQAGDLTQAAVLELMDADAF